MSHRVIVQWNQWLNHELGQLSLKSEQAIFEQLLKNIYGKHLVLIGLASQLKLIKTLDFPCQLLVTSLPDHQQRELKTIEACLHELPLASGSVDLVILPHILEMLENPRQVLAEACRIVRPEGHILICGFNRSSLWGLTEIIRPHNTFLPKHHDLSPGLLKKWLHLSDFELVHQTQVLYTPPFQNSEALSRFQFMEWLGKKCHLPWGAVYVLMAQAKVLPLTPIRMRWKQNVASRVAVPTGIPDPTVRNSH